MNTFDLPHPHRFYCGTTGTGKTTKFIKDFEGCKHGGIHINYTRVPSPFVRANGDYDIDDIVNAIRSGEKLNYYPAMDKKRAKAEIAWLIHSLFKSEKFSENSPAIVGLDECHILAREGERNEQIELIATTGRTFGIFGVFITQSPAMVAKILVKQSDIHVVFTVSDYERDYFRSKGMDFDKMQSLVRSTNPKEVSHKYCVWSNGLLDGPYQDKI